MAQKDSVAFAKQSAFGTKQTTMEYYADVDTATIDGNPAQLDNVTTVGYRYSNPLDMGEQVYKVGLNFIPRVASLPRILSSFFGAPTTSTVDTSAKKHLFDPVAASALVYHSVLFNRHDPAIVNGTAITDLPYDLAGDVLTISAKTGDFVRASAQFKAGQNDNGRSEPSVTLDTTDRFKWNQAVLYANVNGGGEAAVKVSNFEFTYNTNLEDDHFIMGQSQLASLPVGTQAAGLKFTAAEEDSKALADWYRYALKTSSRDSIALRLLVTGSTLVGATTQYTGLEVKLWNSEIIDAPLGIDAKTRSRGIDVSARANYDTGNTKFVTATVWNSVASY
jgi:hypothetical protein